MLLATALTALYAGGSNASDKVATVRPGKATEADQRELHRALGLLQYVLGDYPAAIDETGYILNEDEFLEQNMILDEVAAILENAGRSLPGRRGAVDALRWTMDNLREAVAERQPPSVVTVAVRKLRDAVIETYGLHLAPDREPRLESGQKLYQQSCSACHGGDGRARTSLALRLAPPPVDFRSPRLDATISPYQVFNIVTFGIPGTAMPSFETLDEDARWDLAFQVMAMRHDRPKEDPSRGKAPKGWPSMPELARSTDAELGDWFLARGVRPEALKGSVASARYLHR